jgi:hypothetical protein
MQDSIDRDIVIWFDSYGNISRTIGYTFKLKCIDFFYLSAILVHLHYAQQLYVYMYKIHSYIIFVSMSNQRFHWQRFYKIWKKYHAVNLRSVYDIQMQMELFHTKHFFNFRIKNVQTVIG